MRSTATAQTMRPAMGSTMGSTMQSTMRPMVRAASRRRGGSLALGLAIAAWLVGCLAIGAWVRLQTIEAGYGISEQRKERVRLIEANRKLELDLARLSALDRIEAIASGKLGMKFPVQSQVVKLP